MSLTAKVLVNIALITLTIVLGYFLQKTGKPYSPWIFQAHKLLTIAFTVFMVFILISFIRANGIAPIYTVMLIAAGVSLILLMISGGLLSVDHMEKPMELLHKATALTFTLSIAGIFYLLLKPIVN
jgi:hypothetical protein